MSVEQLSFEPILTPSEPELLSAEDFDLGAFFENESAATTPLVAELQELSLEAVTTFDQRVSAEKIETAIKMTSGFLTAFASVIGACGPLCGHMMGAVAGSGSGMSGGLGLGGFSLFPQKKESIDNNQKPTHRRGRNHSGAGFDVENNVIFQLFAPNLRILPEIA